MMIKKQHLTVFTISIDDVHIVDTHAAYCQQLTLTVATVSENMLTLSVATAPLIVSVYTKQRVHNKGCYSPLVLNLDFY